jgi:hypothetical protein
MAQILSQMAAQAAIRKTADFNMSAILKSSVYSRIHAECNNMI